MNSCINGPNSSLKYPTTVSNIFFGNKKAEMISDDHETSTKLTNICQCGRFHCPGKTEIKPTSFNSSYDNMGYG